MRLGAGPSLWHQFTPRRVSSLPAHEKPPPPPLPPRRGVVYVKDSVQPVVERAFSAHGLRVSTGGSLPVGTDVYWSEDYPFGREDVKASFLQPTGSPQCSSILCGHRTLSPDSRCAPSAAD